MRWLYSFFFSKLEIFALLVAKNFRKQIANKLTLLISIFLPVIFALALVFYGYSLDQEYGEEIVKFDAVPLTDSWKALIEKINSRRNQMIKEQSTFQGNVFIPQIMLGYAPNVTDGINKLMVAALGKLSLSGQQIASYKSCESLRVRASADQHIASICFDYDPEKDEGLPNGLPMQLKFSIIMPSEFRLYEHTWIGASWSRDHIYDNNHFLGEDNVKENGDFIGYIREGFLPLQYHVSYTYLEMAADPQAKPIPEVELRRYDADPNINILFAEGVDIAMILILIVGFIFPVTVLTKHIVEERECGQNFGLQINNINITMQTAAWYFNGLCQFLITAIILALTLKIEWNGQRAAIRKCPLHIMIVFFISYIISAVGFVILMAAIMRTTKMTLAIVPIFWVVSPLPFLSSKPFESLWSNILFLGSSFTLCNVMFSHGIRKMLRFEEFPTQLTSDQYLFSNVMWHEHSLFRVIGCFYFQALIYLLLALLLFGNICPCLIDILTCKYLRIGLNVLRRVIKKYRRKRKHAREQKIRMKAAESRRISELADNKEKLTRTTILNNPIPETRSESPPEEVVDEKDLQPVKGTWTWWHSYWNPSGKDSTMEEAQRRAEYEKFKQYGVEDEGKVSNNNSSIDQETQSHAEDMIPVIEFRHIFMKYSKSFVLKNFSLKIFKGEVVVLLGHNASGKTTLLKILSGEISPTAGSAYISGYDVEKHSPKAFRNVGMALNQIDLFTEFTLNEHLMYFCRLRGMRRRQSQEDIDSYLKSLELETMRDKMVKSLTPGYKQLLNTLCAFAGRTKIILLDTPIEGVDEHKARLFVEFVAEQKAERTIFFTTNHPKVASSLADRIAILVKGCLHSFATEKRLFQRYKDAYRLICYIRESCDANKLFTFLSYYIPEIEMQSNMGNMVVFLINFSDLINLVKLLENLPKHLGDLHVVRYHLVESSLDLIMFNALSYEGVIGKETPIPTRNSQRMTLDDIAFNTEALQNVAHNIRRIDETQLKVMRNQRLFGVRLILAHIGVLIKKRSIIDIRYSVLPIIQLFLPVVLAFWTLSRPHLRSTRDVSSTIDFQLSHYDDTSISLMQQSASLEASKTGPIYAASQQYLKEGNIYHLAADIDIMEYIRDYMSEHHMLTDTRFVLAALFGEDKVEALFNYNLHRTAPLSLALVMDALAIGFVNENSRIIVSKESLPYSTLHKVNLQPGLSCHDSVFIFTMCFCYCCIWTLPLLYNSLSRGHRYGRLELIAGMRQGTLMVATLIYGMLKMSLSLLPINAAIITFRYKLLMNMDSYLLYIYILLSIGLCVLSLNNFITIWIMDTQTFYVFILTFHFWGILLYLLLYELNVLDDPDKYGMFLLDFHPFYALIHNLLRMHNISLIKEMCSDYQTFATSVYLELCQIKPNCCDKKLQKFQLFYHLLPTHSMMLVLWLLFYLRLNWKCRNIRRMDDKLFWDSDPDSKYDQDILHMKQRNDMANTWIYEKTRVRTLERPQIKDKALHVENLGMFFGLKVVLKHINFMLERNQVIAILGRNGSGKTVLVQTILGIYPTPSTGHITSYHKGTYELNEQEDYKHCGYSAQEDEIKDGLTVIEVFQLVLRIRGIKKANVKQVAQTLCQVFDLYKFRFHSLTYCSRGVMKRLSIAVAMIGYAGLILLDEPFAYLDIMSRRLMDYLFQNLCTNSQAILYTCSDSTFAQPAHRCVTLNQFGRMEGIGERMDLQQNVYSTYYQVEVLFNLSDVMQAILSIGSNDYSQHDASTLQSATLVSADIEEETEVEVSSEESDSVQQSVSSSISADLNDPQSQRENNNRRKYWMVYSLIEQLFPHAIIKSISYQRACFWLSTHMYNIPNVLVNLHKNRQTFYSFSITPPAIDTIYLHLSGRPDERRESFGGHFD